YIADGKTIVLSKNDAILLKPGTIRTRIAINEPVKYVSFNFSVMPDVELPSENYLQNCITLDIRKLIAFFSQAHLTMHYHSKEKVANLLNLILFELMDVITLKSANPHVLRIARHVDEHITEKMSLQSISNEIGLTKEYTAYIFKKQTNKTITNYINERKMLLAK
ncbi:MAG: helix-turn-helix transcriptional regulator, partial [Clostridia bacterium]|nr:helix-turn-helix transcriptional regulator [Clostridia bacterium]